jgi:hypothetical protein
MPVDFARVPPRVVVPDPPHLIWPLWAMLFAIVMSAGAALSVYILPPSDGANNLWFWISTIAYPAMAWLFLLCWWLGWRHARRSTAEATNYVNERELQRCHQQASQPLAVLSHAWCFSESEEKNGVAGLVEGNLKLDPRVSLADPDTDVTARWIDIPGQAFYSGSEVAENARRIATFEWLLLRLLGKLASDLRVLPASLTLRVTLSIAEPIDAEAAGQLLRRMLIEMRLHADVTVEATNENVSLFQIDAWLDSKDAKLAHLLVAIQLRNAISEVLAAGSAEAGVALLFGLPSHAQTPTVHVHRPSKGAQDAIDATLALATRWGASRAPEFKASWERSVSPPFRTAIQSSSELDPNTSLISLDTSVGDCGIAGSWLALALASQQAMNTAEPQLVLVQEGGELIALTCKKHT